MGKELLGSLELNRVYQFDVLEGLKLLPDNSVDSIVTDPPYELGFMGKSWDSAGIAYSVELWKECLRVLKHGGHLLAFGGTRTYHRMACAIEDSGFEIRDQIQWIYGSGFPKSQDVSRVIDKKHGESRGKYDNPITDEAKKWHGYGTALKPANEPIVLARKPLSEKTVVENLLKWETGVLNIDESRIAYDPNDTNVATNPSLRKTINGGNGGKVMATETERIVVIPNSKGRFPANVIMDEEAMEILDEQSGVLKSGGGNKGNKKEGSGMFGNGKAFETVPREADSGGASRFFYCAKAKGKEKGEYNTHPTVKPIKLMQYLVKLVTPQKGIVLDPFSGSGTTLLASKLNDMRFIGFELEREYIEIANKRLDNIEDN